LSCEGKKERKLIDQK